MSKVQELDTSRFDLQVHVHLVWHEPGSSRPKSKTMSLRADAEFNTGRLTRCVSEPVQHKALGRRRQSRERTRALAHPRSEGSSRRRGAWWLGAGNMTIKTVAAVAVAFVAGASVMYLWQGRREVPAVVDEIEDVPVAGVTSSSVAPASPSHPAPVLEVAEAANSPPPIAQPSDPPGTEFDAILKRSSSHARFEEEARDPLWATEMEDILMESYAGKPDVVVSSIQCKTTICVVLVSGLPGMDEKSLSEVALKGSLRKASSGDKIMTYKGAATDDKGNHSVAVVTYRYILDERAPAGN